MQKQYQGYQEITNSLKSTCKLINLDHQSKLYQDVIAISNHLANPNFQIAVFGPFNHGKSTLLNAMLGNRTLPIDLIPTTGAAITIKYGSDVRTRIMLVDGTEIYRSGTDILQKFAILDGNRQMRKDVASVEVFCPHPFLETGVEFVDLPGTNDREAQDNLVRDKLLGTDLVIQLLDARKLMTLGERENLRDWLLDRGIKTVIFVANFLNLLEPEEQKQVQNRLLFVAESFRSELPAGFSNLYRVDALPALRARLKGDVALANSSGLAAFETALQNIVGILQQNTGGVRLPRIEGITSQIQRLLVDKIYKLNSEIKIFDDKENAKNEIKQKAKNLIEQGFNTSVYELRNWLSLPNLLAKYQSDIAVALAENNLQSWQTRTLKKDLTELQLAVIKWLYQAYEFFKSERPEDLKIPFPNTPQITLPAKQNNTNDITDPGSIAVGGGIGWLLGGPVGAAVVGSISYLLNKNIQKAEENIAKESYHQQVAKICITEAENYLSSFSSQGLSILAEYEQKAVKVINFQVSQEPREISQKREDIKQLQHGFNQLLTELEKVNIKTKYQPYKETPKPANTQTPPQENSTKYTYTEKKVELPPQQVYTPPEPNTPQVKVETPRQQVYTPPPNPAETEAKFRAWELDQEIAQMKANMKSPGKQQQTNANQKAQNPPKTQVEKDKIARAYKILGLQPTASFAEVKQAYKTLVKKWHPDLFVNQPQMQKQVQEKIRLVNEAYNILAEL
ncbi:dynamin family protein [Anabaena cylindrica FACHB-243]|uniref:Dynamin family protein n=1 Tax=Anabaena cylindrica (strain ATCC 27899 / PCC 7122) TaxID=272123 RepID=K9ZJ39_ANACC|nr:MULTISPECIES: dynamin family protein [Anabaena]AFZ59238.1 Dynamin family protein [Anabaena cylindrica PCC 7122]MBD2416593.1 dynamin family protein [Anabaena cylindrica FACHB-243]MBY5280908.1 DnaJ domain-containing protein [Anabaena sp. CCAP 1446/1C]MBY5310539.1 DnaJ domain-containing protein [Anabaena sp. CCAP 1446/1C]MCM2407531.1 dynamin family protein [Anabaena sp. CCAP 1446/1C]